MNHRSQTPEPGDLIEIFRGRYQHWAVYVGGGCVVHVTSPPGASVSGALSSSLMSKKAIVMKQKLTEVVGNNQWRINNSLDKKYKPRSRHIIVEEALMQEGERMKYSVIRKNCEHFVNELRYGKHESPQVVQEGIGFALACFALAAVRITAGLIARAGPRHKRTKPPLGAPWPPGAPQKKKKKKFFFFTYLRH